MCLISSLRSGILRAEIRSWWCPRLEYITLSSVQSSCSVMSNSLWPHGLQHARLPCPSPTPGACSNSCPLSRWCHPTILYIILKHIFILLLHIHVFLNNICLFFHWWDLMGLHKWCFVFVWIQNLLRDINRLRSQADRDHLISGRQGEA